MEIPYREVELGRKKKGTTTRISRLGEILTFVLFSLPPPKTNLCKSSILSQPKIGPFSGIDLVYISSDEWGWMGE
jgi:hypothetical protein